MAFCQQFDYDIFVSYAHGPQVLKRYKGHKQDLLSSWTGSLVDDLSRQLDVYLQVKQDDQRVAIWMDPDLENHRPLSDALKSKLERTALMLVIMSPFYLDSQWCRRELDWFTQDSERTLDSGRLFVVRALPTDETRWPASLKDRTGHALPGYTFHPPAQADGFCDPYGWPTPTTTTDITGPS